MGGRVDPRLAAFPFRPWSRTSRPSCRTPSDGLTVALIKWTPVKHVGPIRSETLTDFQPRRIILGLVTPALQTIMVIPVSVYAVVAVH